MSKKPAKQTSYPEFLKELLEAKSPTGHEFAAQKVIDDHVEKSADKYSKDALGNRIAELKGDGGPTLMFAGHIDEIGLIISHVDDKGYLYFEFLGGHDQIIPSGRRLHILTRNGPVLGITGKRAVGAVGFASLRGGSVAGDHSVHFLADNERVVLSHLAENRAIFARGAVRAGLWLIGKEPGRYTMPEVLGI